MKNIFTLQKLFFCFVLLVSTMSVVHAQDIVHIPDANFKKALVDNPAINTNGDSEIQVSEANSYSGFIEVDGLDISDLTGIEAFISLMMLNCNNNLLNTLDVNSNVALLVLSCTNNNLSNLDISQNSSLVVLDCSNNYLSSLDVSNNIALNALGCSGNNLTSLDLRRHTALTSLYCDNNQLGYLDLSKHTTLIKLNCSSNNLTSLNIQNGNNNDFIDYNTQNNTNLSCIQVDDVDYANANLTNKDASAEYSMDCGFSTIVYIPDVNLKKALVENLALNTNGDYEIQVSEAESYVGSLSLSNLGIKDLAGIEAFTSLTSLYCDNNQLVNLDLSQNTTLTTLNCSYNNLASLNIQNGNNNNLTSFNSQNNPPLACIQVDNEEYANINFTNKDTWSEFSEDCWYPIAVYIPDAKFKAALVNNIDINTNGDNEIQISEAKNYSGDISISNLDIKDLTGIEAFATLRTLNCASNNLTSLDLSKNDSLLSLDCSNNQLTSLDLGQNTKIAVLTCSVNNLVNLDLGKNTNLQVLLSSNNLLINLDLSKNTMLFMVSCTDNDLTSLNIQNGNNIALTGHSWQNNPNLTCIQVDDVDYANANFTDKDAWAEFSTDCDAITSVKSGLARITNIYPNPASSVLTITTTEEIISKEVIGLDGLIKLKDRSSRNTLDVSTIPGGVYFVRIKTQRGMYQDQFVKQ